MASGVRRCRILAIDIITSTEILFLLGLSVLHVYLCNAMHVVPADAIRCQILWNWSCMLTAMLVLRMELGSSTREECTTSNH